MFNITHEWDWNHVTLAPLIVFLGNQKTKPVQIVKIVVKNHTKYVQNVGNICFQKSRMGR